MKQSIGILLVAALLGMPIQGCKKESPTESPAPGPAAPVQTAFPTGTFKASDSDGQWVQVDGGRGLVLKTEESNEIQ